MENAGSATRAWLRSTIQPDGLCSQPFGGASDVFLPSWFCQTQQNVAKAQLGSCQALGGLLTPRPSYVRKRTRPSLPFRP